MKITGVEKVKELKVNIEVTERKTESERKFSVSELR